MKSVLKVIYNIVRGLCRYSIYLVFIIIARIIKFLTFEKGKEKQITVRKAKRIRFFSKIKLVFHNILPDFISKFLGFYNYKNYINTHLRNGLQLR